MISFGHYQNTENYCLYDKNKESIQKTSQDNTFNICVYQKNIVPLQDNIDIIVFIKIGELILDMYA